MAFEIGDGGYGSVLAPHVRAGSTSDELCLREPPRVIDLHLRYIDAGARLIHSNSFMAFRHERRRRDDVYRAARACLDEAIAGSDGERCTKVATIGPAGTLPCDYYRDIEMQLELEYPRVLIATLSDGDQASAAFTAWSEVATGVDAWCTVSLTVSPSRGDDSWQWIGTLDVPDGVGIGLGCCDGTAGLRVPIELLAEYGAPLRVAPSAGRPDDGASLVAERWVEELLAVVDGLPVVELGGCCGTTPEHIGRLASANQDDAGSPVEHRDAQV